MDINMSVTMVKYIARVNKGKNIMGTEYTPLIPSF